MVIARGFETEAWFDDDQAVGSGGINRPEPYDLLLGNSYYRFASSTTSKDAQLGGGWWIDYETFKYVEDFSRNNVISLGDAARQLLALPYQWTRVDRLIKAFLTVPLRAYAGRGKVASSKGETWTPDQGVRQLYIPGLYKKNASLQLYEKAFPNPQIQYTASRKPL